MVVATIALLSSPASAYVLIQPPASRMLMTIDVDPVRYPFTNGTMSPDEIIATALLQWNNVGVGWRPDYSFFSYEFESVSQSCVPDGKNTVTVEESYCGGFVWGDAIAVTVSFIGGNGRRVEADVIGNANLLWDYYSGPLRFSGGVPVIDIYRTMIHEAGHIVGLGHENSVPAIMGTYYGAVDYIQADDIAGAHAVAYPPPPGGAGLSQPSGSILTARPTYVWNAVPNATDYYLWVEDVSGTKIKQWYTALEAGCPTAPGTCAITPGTGVGGNSRWWIQTWNPAGYGPWTGPLLFSAPPPPAQATLVDPQAIVNTVTPTYTWNAVPGSTWYYLWVDDSTGTRIKQWYRAIEVGCENGSGTCSATPDTRLAAGAARWWVQTWSASGYGPWSTPLSFTVVPPPPPSRATLGSPSGTVATLNPTYTWDAVAGSTWYYLWVDDSTGIRINQWYRSAEAGCPNEAGTCSVTPNTTLTAGPARWWIQTWSPNGDGPWSLPMEFTATMPPLPGQATLVSPSGAIATRTPTYTWNAVAGSTWYYLWVDDSTGTRIMQWYRAAEAGCASGTPSCSITPSVELTAGAARWWIQTWNPAGEGPWSARTDFTVP